MLQVTSNWAVNVDDKHAATVTAKMGTYIMKI